MEFIVGFEPTARISDHVNDGGSLRCSPHQTKHCMNSEKVEQPAGARTQITPERLAVLLLLTYCGCSKKEWYHRWDSNPHYTDFESVDSAVGLRWHRLDNIGIPFCEKC